jgi:hypothetical protein
MNTEDRGTGSTEYLPRYSYSTYRRIGDALHNLSRNTKSFLNRKYSEFMTPVLSFLRSTKENKNSFDDSQDLTKWL